MRRAQLGVWLQNHTTVGPVLAAWWSRVGRGVRGFAGIPLAYPRGARVALGSAVRARGSGDRAVAFEATCRRFESCRAHSAVLAGRRGKRPPRALRLESQDAILHVDGRA